MKDGYQEKFLNEIIPYSIKKAAWISKHDIKFRNVIIFFQILFKDFFLIFFFDLGILESLFPD